VKQPRGHSRSESFFPDDVQLGDGCFATLNDVVQHYNSFFGLGLDDKQAHDLVEYLKSLLSVWFMRR
jgi:hypothetical protein